MHRYVTFQLTLTMPKFSNQARNYMRAMKIGDSAFFYHSNAGSETGIVGIVKVAREAHVDHTCLDKKSKYYDPKSTPDNPRWSMVDVKLDTIFEAPLLLSSLRLLSSDASSGTTEEERRLLSALPLLQRGSRLSIQPLSEEQWEVLIRLSKACAP
jgi:predicted RNA-binding protein with PUA-like domain